MSSKNPKRCLDILDVGHGCAAVLRDEGGVVVFDTGRGSQVDQYLGSIGIEEVEAIFLTHADADHIGGAITLLLNAKLRVRCVFLNPDPTKTTTVFNELRYALADAAERCGTRIEPSLTTSTKISRHGASIEVLYPSGVAALGGVGGKTLDGTRSTSNSLSAAIRVTGGNESAVLLGGDIEFECLQYWADSKTFPLARALVFPHHGGLPGSGDESDAAQFASKLAAIVKPETVIFSIHRERFNLPRDKVIEAILTVINDVRFVCTQLPERLRPIVSKEAVWSMHYDKNENKHLEGNIEIEFFDKKLIVKFPPSAKK